MQATNRSVSLMKFAAIALIACGVSGAAAPGIVKGNKTIERNMKAIDKSMRELSAIVKDDEKTKESLKLVLGMQRKLLSTKMLKPGVVTEASRDERDALQHEYRVLINKALLEVIEVEIEILEGKGDAALQRINGALSTAIKAGHGKFRKRSP